MSDPVRLGKVVDFGEWLRRNRPTDEQFDQNERLIAADRAADYATGRKETLFSCRLRRLREQRVPLRPAVLEAIAANQLRDEAPLRDARDWLRDARDGSQITTLVMLGLVGTGKTVALGWLGLEFDSFRYVKSEAGTLRYCSRFGPTRELHDALGEPGIVLWDESGGVENSTPEQERAAVTDVLDMRLGRPLVLAGNIESKEQLRERFGERFYSRLYEVGAVRVYEGRDLRRVR